MPEVTLHMAEAAVAETISAVQSWLDQHSLSMGDCEIYTLAGGNVAIRVEFNAEELAETFQRDFAALSIAEDVHYDVQDQRQSR